MNLENVRIGHGYDVHRFSKNRKLVLGGVEIPFKLGLLGHSDADVLTHSIMDSLLGAAALGDIGSIFPDFKSEYLDANSLSLLKCVCEKLSLNNYKILNIDSTLVAQEPKVFKYINKMRANIASACGLCFDSVSVKATTEENLGFTGSLLGIKSYAVCLLLKI